MINDLHAYCLNDIPSVPSPGVLGPWDEAERAKDWEEARR